MKEQRGLTYAKTLSRMIQVETISKQGVKEAYKFREFHYVLKELFPTFFRTVKIEEFDGSLLMKWEGTDESLEPVLFMNHQDVVDAEGTWKHEPFSGDIADGRVWGRGTLDDKGGLFGMLQGAEELMVSGFQPKRDIYFVSTCSEETDGSGAATIAQVMEERGLHFYMILDEGGMILYDPIGGADGHFAMIGVGEKSCIDLKFIAKSKGGHASTPGKDTPLVRLGKFMAAVENSNIFDVEISPVMIEMLKRFAPYMKGLIKFACGHPNLFKGILKRVIPGISSAAGAMMKTTVAFTMAKGSNSSNVLPERAWIKADMRCSHHQGIKKSIRAITELAKKYDIETEVTYRGKETSMSDYNSDSFKLLEAAVAKYFPDVATVPYFMTGASDCRFFSHLTEHHYRFVPFNIDDEQYESIHGIDENVNIDTLEPAVKFYKYVMKEV